MGRTGHPALILGTAAIVVAAIGTGVALVRDDIPIAKAPTNLADVHDAVLVSPAGVATVAHDGQRVPAGYVLRTGSHGSADLVTRGRVVYVSRAAAVAVVDGAHQQLLRGRAVYDAQHGDGLRVDVAGDELTVPNGSAIEAQRSVSVQIGALAGPARITSASAREVTVAPLSQAVLNGDALAAATAPLHLNDGPGETHAVPALVDADLRLKTLASGIDASGAGEAGVISASWHRPTAALPAATPRSEQVMPIVIADATTFRMTTAAQRYRSVVNVRLAGGSWGVALALLSGSPSKVENTLDTLLKDEPNGQIGQVSLLAGSPRAPGGRTSSHPSSPTNPTHPTAPPTSAPPGGGAAGGGTPTPTPTKGPVKKVVGTVGGVVQTVVKLLPIKKLLTTPTPSASPGSGGLLGGLLHH